MNIEQHVMVLERTYFSGVGEWYCPTCGRRLLIKHGPRFRKAILETGDEFAIHSGGRVTLPSSSTLTSPVDSTGSAEEQPIPIDDPSLAPWLAWMEQIDFESLWTDR